MARLKSLTTTPGERFSTGTIATLVSVGGSSLSRHFVGSSREAAWAIAAYCDEHDLKVLVLSTPASIYRDLQGDRRPDADYTQGDRTMVTGGGQVPSGLRLPEPTALGRIGRMDLLA